MVVLGYPMLITKFQGHWSIGSGEEDVLKFFTIYGHGGHTGHVTMTVCIYFHSLSPRRLSREPGLVDRELALHAGSRGFDSHRGHMSE